MDDLKGRMDHRDYAQNEWEARVKGKVKTLNVTVYLMI